MNLATTSEVLTVGAVTARVAQAIRADCLLSDCTIRGELSNYRIYHSGHHYFTLKDADAELRCVMFRGDAARLRFDPADGLAVRASGRVDVYEKKGEYQLYVRALQHDGLGALFEAYQRLRERLEAEGLFRPERKRPLPRYPRRVAIITSPSGAAVRDMVRILRQRWPAVRILLLEAVVQGEQAAPSLCRALEAVGRLDDIDLVLLGRGGGSIEDLWAFNEEMVVRAVVACPVPVISAVGHETDFTICDFAADVRAATPTHAAELAVPEIGAEAQHHGQLEARLNRALAQRVETARLGFQAIESRCLAAAPSAVLAQQMQRLDELSERLECAVARLTERASHHLARLTQTLAALDPSAVLARGYAILRRERDGKVAMDPADLPPGTLVEARLAGGSRRLVAGEEQVA
ncbi:MAG: exodeoxyribonuclease VII large subunit [Armatimonadetes bacterium]|nr:exodeoxyribonuclease VII large subunit [Armatimonadota bacterium]